MGRGTGAQQEGKDEGKSFSGIDCMLGSNFLCRIKTYSFGRCKYLMQLKSPCFAFWDY